MQLDEAATHLALAGVLTEAKLLRKADARSWKLGEEYLAAGAVVQMEISEGRVTGKVQGSSLYPAQLSITSRNDLDYALSPRQWGFLQALGRAGAGVSAAQCGQGKRIASSAPALAGKSSQRAHTPSVGVSACG